MPKAKQKSSGRDPIGLGTVNQLVRDLQMGSRHDEMSRFDLTIEYVQGAGQLFFWRAYVKTNGHVSAASKLHHATPGAAVDELWCAIVKE